MAHTWLRMHDGVVTLTLHVQPGAKRTEVVGLHGDALKIKLAAPPVEGKANEILLRYMADWFGVSLRNVELKQGELSRHKVVAISNSTVAPETLLDSLQKPQRRFGVT